jgi:hypothetical protein
MKMPALHIREWLVLAIVVGFILSLAIISFVK